MNSGTTSFYGIVFRAEDMDLTNTDFTPIGTEEHPFEGIFEGPSEAGELPTLKKSGLPASAPAACSGKPTQVLR